MPKTSIVILTYNQLAYTQICLESVRLYTSDYEIIVVDNASTDGTAEWLKEQKDIIAIFNAENKGFPAGCNQGILKARGEVIVLLNNDTIVTPRWLDNLLICLNSSEKIGAVGAYSNNAGNNQNMAVNYNHYNFGEIIFFAEKVNVSNKERWEEATKLGGFCFAVKKSVVDAAGLLDEKFYPGYFEDDDYSFRIRRLGYKLMICGDVFIHHYGHTSFKNDTVLAKSANVSILENKNRFIEKWGFDSFHGCYIRHDIIQLMMQRPDCREAIRVLDTGCGCGATLLKIKHLFQSAALFGIEFNRKAAATIDAFAAVKVGDAEKILLDYPDNYFDFILFPNVLETLNDPAEFLTGIKKYLKPTGEIIARIANVMHFSVMERLLSGRWAIQNQRVIRFFTLATIQEMFAQSRYLIKQIKEITNPLVTDNQKNFLDYLHYAVLPEKKNELLVEQYIVKAQIK